MPQDDWVKQELNKTADQILDVPCPECKRPTKHKVLVSADVEGEEWATPSNAIQYWSHHQIVQCQGCETISFRISRSNSEDGDFREDGTFEYYDMIDFYPGRQIDHRAPLKGAYLLPTNVSRIYNETLKAMNSNQPVLAGIGIRALVETICKDKQAPGNALEQKIDDLVRMGVLTGDGAKILHKIRTLGNNAAHEVKPHEPQQLGLAMDVCEHLMQGVYLIPHHAKEAFE